uniref:Magnetosome protein MamQ n=3 Tax=Pseudomonadota TaxID=1224 RepID=C4RAG4_9PROT|nr:magnetosome protein MamQ [Magnetovibrio blakemorei]
MVTIIDQSIINDKQRLRRSEALLNQLYREEVSPAFHAPAMRGVKVMAVISFLALLLFTGTLFFKFNNFIMLREDVLTKQGNLESAIQRRTNLFPNMVNLTLSHASLEHTIFAYTSKARSELIKKSNLPQEDKDQLVAKAEQLGAAGALPKGWEQALDSFKGGTPEASLGRLLAVVEKYPDIQSAKTYEQMMLSLVDMENMVTERRVAFNESLLMYNVAISKFPWSLLADWTDFMRIEYFVSEHPGAAAPLITKDTYQQLVPFLEENGGNQ